MSGVMELYQHGLTEEEQEMVEDSPQSADDLLTEQENFPHGNQVQWRRQPADQRAYRALDEHQGGTCDVCDAHGIDSPAAYETRIPCHTISGTLSGRRCEVCEDCYQAMK